MMSAVSLCSSASSFGRCRCVERCRTRIRQVRRSDTGRTRRTCSIASRRREGLKKSASTPPAESPCPARGPLPASSAAHFPAPDRWPCGRLRPHPMHLVDLEATIFLAPPIQRLLAIPICRHASTAVPPRPTITSTSRSFAMICSGVNR